MRKQLPSECVCEIEINNSVSFQFPFPFWQIWTERNLLHAWNQVSGYFTCAAYAINQIPFDPKANTHSRSVSSVCIEIAESFCFDQRTMEHPKKEEDEKKRNSYAWLWRRFASFVHNRTQSIKSFYTIDLIGTTNPVSTHNKWYDRRISYKDPQTPIEHATTNWLTDWVTE